MTSIISLRYHARMGKAEIILGSIFGTFAFCLMALAGYPLVGVGIFVTSLVVPVFFYSGFLTAFCSFGILALGSYGAIGLYAPSLQSLTQVATLGMSAIGIVYGIRWMSKFGTKGAVTKFTLLYLLTCAMSVVVSIPIGTSYALRAGLVLIAPVLITIAIVGVVRSSEYPEKNAARKNTLTVTLVLIVVLNGAVALRQSFSGFTANEMAQIKGGASTYLVGGEIRSIGLMPTSQDFGLLASCLAPALVLAAVYAPRKYKFVTISAGILLVVAGALGLTRTTLIATAVAVVLGLIFWGKGISISRPFKYAAVVGVFGLVAYQVIQASTNERIGYFIDRALTLGDLSSDRSFNDRMELIYPRAIQAMVDYPIGAGAGSAGPISQAYPDLSRFGEFTTDSGYLMIGVQNGLFGLFAFIGMLISIMLWLARTKTTLSVAGAAAVLALVVAMVSAQYWALGAPMAIIATCVGLGIASIHEAKEDSQPKETERLPVSG